MRTYFSLLVISVFACFFVYACGSESTNNQKEDAVLPATDGPIGMELYSANCVICHGENGALGLAGASDLSQSVLSHENTVHVITNGRNGMRGFSSDFSAAEI